MVPTAAPGPRLQQALFASLVALDMVSRFAGPAPLTVWPLASAVLLAGVTLGVFALSVLPLSPRARHTGLVVAVVLDIAVIGLCRLSPEFSAAAVLLLGPAIWLGLHYSGRGVALAAVANVVLVAIPGLVYGGADGVNLSRAVLPTVAAAGAAYVVATTYGRLAAAAATIESQRRFADAVFDTVDVGLVLLDRTGRYQTINRRHEDFMRAAYPDGHAGLAGQVGHVFGSDATTLLTREDMPTYRASQGEEFADQRMWLGADPRTRRAVSVSARAVRDADGTFAGAALAYKDVTSFMKALQVKDEFVASVSHELRTPLTSIHGYASLISERDDLPPQVRDQLAVVVRNSERLNRLVDDLLHAAQADTGSVQVVRVGADVAAIVRQSVQAALPAAAAGGIELAVSAPDTLTALVDAQRIGQVVDNLVSNAIKYTPSGGRVEVVLGVDHERIDIAVRDTGIGIGAADRDRLFTRFFRARHVEEQSIPGIGLGLSITKAIVESHGGRIEVDSEAGAGSVFRVRIPLDREHTPAAPVSR